jgi:hypothetical protein
MKRRTLGACLAPLLLAGGLLLGCRPPPAEQPEEAGPAGPPWFADVTEAAGLDFVHDAGPVDGKYFLPQIIGSGAALFDFNGDGLLDILLLQNGGPAGAKNRLYQQRPGGRFQDVSAGSGLDFAGYNMGVAIGDVNNDGWPDVLITGYRGVRLFLNQGNGTFTDVTREAGLHNPLWATSAAFVDYDRDGWLDLVVVNYLDYDPSLPCTSANGVRDYCTPKAFAGTSSKLFRNLGRLPGPAARGTAPLVRFKDVSVESGLGLLPGPALGVVCADFNGDGWPDIFVANDASPNHLWINQRNGTFKEEAAVRGVAVNAMGQAEGNMGIGWGDVDGDGLQDLFVTHLTHETNTLWKQGPRGLFRDVTVATGLSRPRWRATGFGTMLADFDHDGALDAAVANGRVTRKTEGAGSGSSFWEQYAERNQVFANDGRGRFRDVSLDNPAVCGTANVARGLAVGDYDNDGALDLLLTTVAGRVHLYRNVAPRRGHWLRVRAVDPARRRDPLGAEVTVRAGGRVWVHTLQSSGSYLSANDPRPHFGLGKVDHIDAIDVRWPDGPVAAETFTVAGVDREVILTRGKGRSAKRTAGPASSAGEKAP